jgi:hypothetical protein
MRYIVFNRTGQYIVTTDSLVRAIQSVLMVTDTVAREWTCHRLDSYPAKLQTRLIAESIEL